MIHGKRGEEHGSILVLTLLVCIVLLGLGLTAMWLSSESGKVSTNVAHRAEAYYAAEAGLERARGILVPAASWEPMLAGCSEDALYVDEPVDADKGKGKGRVLCAGTVPLYKVKIFEKQPGVAAESATQVGSLNTVEYTIWIRNDDAEGGSGVHTDANARIIVRSEGTTRNRMAYVALEQIIGRGGGETVKEAAYSQAGMGPTGANSGKAELQ